MTTPPFESAPIDLVKEIITQAEKRLDVQLTVGIAADQRAMTFAGLLFAGVAVMISLAFGRDASASGKPELICMAAGFILSAALACFSSRPIAWNLAGYPPSSWADDVVAKLSLPATYAETATILEESVQENETALRKNSHFMAASMLVSILSAIAGLLAVVI